MVSSIDRSLISYLTAQTPDSSTANANAAAKTPGTSTATSAATATSAKTQAASQAALQRAAGFHKNAVAAQALNASQKTLGKDLQAALKQAGVKLAGAVDFSVSSDGKVEVKGSDADKAAMTAFLKGDTSKPSFASRIATQAQDALKLSSTIQQGAAISQAAKFSNTTGGVMSMYTSLMQQTSNATVVFSVSAGASSLTYPGSLAAKA